MIQNDKFWLGFNLVKGIGPAKLRAIIDHFGSIERAWHADSAVFKQIGIDARTIRSFETTRAQVNLDNEWAITQQKGVQVLHWESPDYPVALQAIPNPPPVLYVQGEILDTDQWAVAIVGTRKLTGYGRQMAREITAGLVHNGVTIISGLARGIDSLAHETAVELGGRTIGVLGSGIDSIYPAENRQLAGQMIAGQGAIVSEYALGVQPESKNFPPRNRVIAGLSLGIVVIEAAERSGALITAKFAREQGREVYALPGQVIHHASKGTNRLIQEGAKLITCAEDILEDLNLAHTPVQQAVQMVLPSSAEEAALLPHLTKSPRHVDQLCRLSGLPTAQVSSTLSLLELKGIVQAVGDMQYVIMREQQATYQV